MRYTLTMVYAKDKLGDLYVMLVNKTKGPTAGYLNGLGGNLHKGENIHAGNAREFTEETGLRYPSTDFKYKGEFHGLDHEYRVFVFTHMSEDVIDPKETSKIDSGELAGWFKVSEIGNLNLVSNLKWIIPITLQKAEFNVTEL